MVDAVAKVHESKRKQRVSPVLLNPSVTDTVMAHKGAPGNQLKSKRIRRHGI